MKFDNNFRLNDKFKELIDEVNVEVYSKNKSSEVFKLNKFEREINLTGNINGYKDEDTIVVQFFHSFIGLS